METTLTLLLLTALATGVVHTLLGPDHTVPLIALARDRRWSVKKTLVLTLGCGLAHLGSALAVAGAAVAFGVSLGSLGLTEPLLGRLAAWILIGFGFAYAAWGLKRAFGPRLAPETTGPKGPRTPLAWVLFLVFVLGPCEPLVPLVMVPGAQGDLVATALVVATFGVATLATMAVTVVGVTFGLGRLPRIRWVDRFGTVVAGSAIGASGLAVAFLGL